MENLLTLAAASPALMTVREETDTLDILTLSELPEMTAVASGKFYRCDFAVDIKL